MHALRRPLSLLLSALLLSLLGACATPRNQAPVEDRALAKTTARPAAGMAPVPVPLQPAPPPPELAAEPAKPLPPGAENAGKPGYYTVKPGDTLIRIGLDNGQNWRDVARWNGVENANLIEVGQVLRVVPLTVDAAAVAARGVAAPKVEVRPLDARAGAAGAAGPVAAPAAAAPPLVAIATQPARDNDDEPAWAWPAAGNVLSGFDESKQKGLAINGKAGDPVLAAADGRVVYAGSGLRGYGNLVIVKHNNIYLSAYAHNQSLLVKEDQVVRRGQKIAEMGASDADRVQLHFEIRRQGKPIDPSRLLPAR